MGLPHLGAGVADRGFGEQEANQGSVGPYRLGHPVRSRVADQLAGNHELGDVQVAVGNLVDRETPMGTGKGTAQPQHSHSTVTAQTADRETMSQSAQGQKQKQDRHRDKNRNKNRHKNKNRTGTQHNHSVATNLLKQCAVLLAPPPVGQGPHLPGQHRGTALVLTCTNRAHHRSAGTRQSQHSHSTVTAQSQYSHSTVTCMDQAHDRSARSNQHAMNKDTKTSMEAVVCGAA